MIRYFRSPRAAGLAALLLLATAVTAAACNRADRPPASIRAEARAAEAQPKAATNRIPAEFGDTLMSRADAARIQGSAQASLWMVEISDFQCPFCKRWHDDSYATIKREYIDSGKIRFAYVNLPLPMHKHAWQAAQVAMCAALQGRFWPMHDSLFASQDRWEKLDSTAAATTFDSLATGIGANVPALRACVRNETLRPLVQADYDRAVQSGVRSTPTFLIGARAIEGNAPVAEFRHALDSALAAATPKR